MSKSRQPGRPARLAGSGRKLVSAFRPSSDTTPVEENEFAKAAKEICYGLAVFRFIFGNEEDTQESPFHGFSPHEIRWANDKSSIRRRQVEDEHRARGVLFSPFMVGPSRNPLKPVSSLMTASQNYSNDVQSKQIKIEKTKVEGVLKPAAAENTLRKSALKHQIRKNIKLTDDDGSPSNSSPTRAIARKFVLPVRSAHSSRVIKPNKRFRDIDGDSYSSNDGIRVKKIRVSIDTDEDSSSSWAGKRSMPAC